MYEWANLLFLRIKSPPFFLLFFFSLLGVGDTRGDWRGRELCDGKEFFPCIPFSCCKAVGKHVFPTMLHLRQLVTKEVQKVSIVQLIESTGIF